MKETIIGFSLSMVKRENTLVDLSRKSDVFSQSNVSVLSPVVLDTLKLFLNSKIDHQRKMLAENPFQIMSALADAVYHLDDRNALMVILPTIDGCLFGILTPFSAIISKTKKRQEGPDQGDLQIHGGQQGQGLHSATADDPGQPDLL
jgi:hypothetical protein